MHRRKKFRFVIFAIAGVMLLTALSGHGQHAAWMQGYATGIAAAADAAAEGSSMAAPVAAHAEMAHHGMHSGFGILGAIIGGIFKLGLFLLMFVFFAKMFGFMMWRLAMGGGHPSWGSCHGWRNRDGSNQSGDNRGWDREEMRKKWMERKRAWAKEHGFTDTPSDDSKGPSDDDRPAEDRFVV